MEQSALVSTIKKKWRELFSDGKNSKTAKLVVALGILGIIFIFISEMIPASKTSQKAEPADSDSVYEMETALEERLYGLISGIEGAGEVRVMVTLESGREYVYATESEKETSEASGDNAVQRNEALSENYIFIEDNDGNSRALLVLEVEPTVKGVAVVCGGAENPVVAERIIRAVTTALGIPSRKVCVLKIA